MLNFSLCAITTPLIGYFGGVYALSSFMIIQAIRYILFPQFFSLSVLAFFIPGIVAGYYLRTQSLFVRVGLPIMCIALFCMHPVGYTAVPYTLYWIFPVLLPSIIKKSFFIEALVATLVAHAVGSTIWLYTMSTNTIGWFSLIPVVWYERCFYAMGMVVISIVVKALANGIDKIFYRYKKNIAIVSP